tara:strand:+ start:544 stop:873 length:330 start_codon:yes stop_codon:yes gene_type:complete
MTNNNYKLTYNQFNTLHGVFKSKNLDFTNSVFIDLLGCNKLALNRYSWLDIRYINTCLLDLMRNYDSTDTYYNIYERKNKKINVKTLSNIQDKIALQIGKYNYEQAPVY